MKLFDSFKLKEILREVLLKSEMEESVIDPLISSLVESSLRGIDSHGINLFPHYYWEIKNNRINKSPNLKFNKTSEGTLILDAQNSLGHFAGYFSMLEAIKMARDNGIGSVSVKNSNHFGASWFFTNLAANQGMIGMAFTNTESLVNAYNSKESFFGTNPFCFSAPMKGEDPFCLDMATSIVPWNKVKNYRRNNIPLQNNWAYDSSGNITLSPHEASSLASIGGYKGFGLGMVIEILCSGLSQGPISKKIPPLYDKENPEDRKISHFFIALDINRFVPLGIFENYMTEMVSQIRSLPKSQEEKVMVPGDKEKFFNNQRSIEGIPVDEELFDELLKISEKFRDSLL